MKKKTKKNTKRDTKKQKTKNTGLVFFLKTVFFQSCLEGCPLALQGRDALAQLTRLGMAAGDELLGGGERTVLEARVATHHLVLERLVFLLQGSERTQVLRLNKNFKNS